MVVTILVEQKVKLREVKHFPRSCSKDPLPQCKPIVWFPHVRALIAFAITEAGDRCPEEGIPFPIPQGAACASVGSTHVCICTMFPSVEFCGSSAFGNCFSCLHVIYLGEDDMVPTLRIESTTNNSTIQNEFQALAPHSASVQDKLGMKAWSKAQSLH